MTPHWRPALRQAAARGHTPCHRRRVPRRCILLPCLYTALCRRRRASQAAPAAAHRRPCMRRRCFVAPSPHLAQRCSRLLGVVCHPAPYPDCRHRSSEHRRCIAVPCRRRCRCEPSPDPRIPSALMQRHCMTSPSWHCPEIALDGPAQHDLLGVNRDASFVHKGTGS